VDEGLTWDDTKGGWYQANVPNIAYPGLGLLITVTSPTTGRLPYGEVADQTGTAQESFSYFGQTTNPSDSYPVIDLGVLQTGQMTTTTVTYHWAWTNCPPAPVTCQAYNFADVPETIAPNPFNASVNAPEPGTLGLLALGSALGLWRRRITRPRAWPKRTNPVAERLQSWQATQRLQP
jgi:hypothetical protein